MRCDALTGLHNRRSFIALMSTRSRVETERREGPYGNPDCMILLDIDHFRTSMTRGDIQSAIWCSKSGDTLA